ncbi:3-oxoacyl-ACP synthase III family protein [Nocardiopsis suaedae]|uniref:Ketoacyl-ACP synthase III n=1 Tax=Nocardiopsis suaedae TaxID=3018444 RepID=A0ABT4TR72_9ACTN|nr:ketoacyl-ACP synthase III [Nocardiopsis suaedae]MDA2806855.1 ketoacyl-ACP synthase III [Nocardiopsis suaedae]
MPIGILALGSHVPDETVENAQVGEWTGVPGEWFEERTGIRRRRYAPDGEATSDLALRAARDLLGRAQVTEREIGPLVVATATPDRPQPATAAVVQAGLGTEPGAAFDVNAVCSGFVYALESAAGLLAIRPSHGAYALVVGADKFSSVMDRGDRRTVGLFGDGAGAALLGTVPDGYGIRATRLVSHGSLHALVEVPAGGTRRPLTPEARRRGEHCFRMEGRSVREYLLGVLPEVVEETVKDAGLSIGDIDRFIFHQANPRLVEKVAAELGADPERVPMTGPEFGNTGAASIPVTLRYSQRQRPFRRGERILLAAVGGGMTAAGAVLVWY